MTFFVQVVGREFPRTRHRRHHRRAGNLQRLQRRAHHRGNWERPSGRGPLRGGVGRGVPHRRGLLQLPGAGGHARPGAGGVPHCSLQAQGPGGPQPHGLLQQRLG